MGSGLDESPALPMKKPNDDLNNDLGEDNIATVEIQLPSNKLDLLKKVLDQVLGGGDEDSNQDNDTENDLGEDNTPPFGQSSNSDLDDNDAEDVDSPHTTASRKVKTMKQAQNRTEAQARRNAIMASLNGTRTANQEDSTKPRNIGLGDDTSHNGKPFQYADGAQYKGEDKYQTRTLEQSEGNSLRSQNPTYSKQGIPTVNPPADFQLRDSYDFIKKEGSPEDSSFYTADWNALNPVPSENAADLKDTFEIPSQQGDEYLKRKTTVAGIVECDGCNNPQNKKVFAVQCLTCNQKVAICEACESEEYCPVCASSTRSASDDTVDEGKTDNGETSETTKRKNQFEGTEMPQKDRDKDKPFDKTKEAELFKAKIATAYAVSYKLICAGILAPDEVDGQVQLWIKDNTSPEAMITQGKLMLRSAQNARERVASAAAEHYNVRSSENIGLSINPQFGQSSFTNPATMEMHEALRGIFSNPYSEDNN